MAWLDALVLKELVPVHTHILKDFVCVLTGSSSPEILRIIWGVILWQLIEFPENFKALFFFTESNKDYTF